MNFKALADTVAWSEIGPALLAMTDDGYNVLVGSTPNNPLLFHDYSKHPNILNRAFDSTAAGRYQIIHPTYQLLYAKLGISAFGHTEQDAMFYELAKDAIPFLRAGNFGGAINSICGIWASLPGNGASQHQNNIDALKNVFIRAGGYVA